MRLPRPVVGGVTAPECITCMYMETTGNCILAVGCITTLNYTNDIEIVVWFLCDSISVYIMTTGLYIVPGYMYNFLR